MAVIVEHLRLYAAVAHSANCGKPVMLRTTQKTVTFREPFLLPGLKKLQPAGDDVIETEEELMPHVSMIVYRRVATFIHLHEVPGDDRITGIANIDPRELEDALARDLDDSFHPVPK